MITVLLHTQYRHRPAHGFGWAALACVFFAVVTALAGALLAVAAGGSGAWGLGWMAWALGIKSAAFALTGVVLMAAGWVEEVVIARPLRDDPPSQYVVEERLD